MNINLDILIFLTLIIATLAYLRWWDRQKVIELQKEITLQRQRYEARILELERRVDFLVEQLQKAGIQIHDLEAQLATHVSVSRETDQSVKPLLLICGESSSACETDRRALRRARIGFQRLRQASKDAIDAELRRRRQDGTLYRWIVISLHTGQGGTALVDGLASPAWWNERLDGVEVVFLATCTGAAVADELAGVVDTVVFVHEEIGDRDASDFVFAFWRRMNEGADAHHAYRQALVECPQIAEYVDIRGH